MSQPIPMQTPLAELLRGVPKDHRTKWEIQWAEDGTPTGHALCPIGKLCHEAADELDSLRTQLAEAKAEIERLERAAQSYLDHSDSGIYRDGAGLRPGLSPHAEDLRGLLKKGGEDD